LEIDLDGQKLASKTQQCPDGGCGLEQGWTLVNDDLAEGSHSIHIVATDQLGHVTTRDVSITIANRPTLSVGGTLYDHAGAALPDGSYALNVSGADSGSGIKSIDVAVDGGTVAHWDQGCALGACAMSQTYTFVNDSFSAGQHQISITTTDQKSHTQTTSFGVDVQNAPSMADSGELREIPNGAYILRPDRPRLHVDARDAGSGLASISVSVDGAQQARSTSAPLDFVYDPTAYADGAHTITVTASDNAGHQTTDQWQVHEDIAPRDWSARNAQAAAADPPPDAPSTQTSARAATVGVPAITAPLVDQTSALSRAALPDPGHLACTAADQLPNFDRFWLGASFEGLPLTDILRRCDVPYPGEPIRANFVSYLYGDCTADTDIGCNLPLEVQTWPLCERDPSMYQDEPGVPAELDWTTIQGTRAVIFDEGFHVELYTAASTVVIFGQYYEQVLRAAEAVQRIAPTTPLAVLPAWRTSSAAALAPPVPGGLTGNLTCT
jgi:hypothetical protein